MKGIGVIGPQRLCLAPEYIADHNFFKKQQIVFSKVTFEFHVLQIEFSGTWHTSSRVNAGLC